MIKRIKIESLEIGMYVQGVSRGEGGIEESFLNTVYINDLSEIDYFRKRGFTYAYVHKDKPTSATTKNKPEAPAPAPEKKTEPAPEKKPNISKLTKESMRNFLGNEEATEVIKVLEEASMDEEFNFVPVEDTGTYKDPVPFEEEVERAEHIKEEAREIVVGTFEEVRLGKGLETAPLKESVEGMVGSVFQNRDALVSLSRLKDFDNYTFGHSINVCILSVTLGRYVGLSKEQLLLLGMSAILHDIGKMRVDPLVLNNPGKLSDDEFNHMQDHTSYGAEILERTDGIDNVTIQVARGHHENYGGGGYPDGLKGKDIHPFSRIVSIADFYDALTTERVYRSGQPPTTVLKGMYNLAGTKFEPELIERFILCLGIYPIGSFVKLSTGEIARVEFINRGNLLEPTVLIVLDKSGELHDDPRPLKIDSSIGPSIISTAPSPGGFDDPLKLL